MKCWRRQSAIRNPSRLTRNLSRTATSSPIPSAKSGLATRDPRRNARPKPKAFVRLPAASGNIDKCGRPRPRPKEIAARTEALHPRRDDRIAKSPVVTLAAVPECLLSGRCWAGKRMWSPKALVGFMSTRPRASGLWTSGAYLQHENSQLSPIPLARKRIPAPSLARRGAIWRGVAP